LYKGRKQCDRGFSLVELIIVVAIMAILMVVLAPTFTKYVDRSRQSRDVSMVSAVVSAVKVAVTDEDYNLQSGDYAIAMDKANGLKVCVLPSKTENADTDEVLKVITAACGAEDTLKPTAKKWETDGLDGGYGLVIYFTLNSDNTYELTYSPLLAEYTGQPKHT